MHVEAVGDLARHAQHPGVDRCDVDRRVREGDRTGRPHGGQQRHGVVLPVDGQGPAGAEGFEDLLDREHVLAQPRSGRVELRPVAPLDMRPHLCPEPEPEAPPARLGQFHTVEAVTMGLRGKATAMPVMMSISAASAGAPQVR